MSRMSIKTFRTPDEQRPFVSHGRAEILQFEQGPVGRVVLEPGWVWSKHVKPIAGTSSCECAHTSYVVSGRMRIVMDDGEAVELKAGDVAFIPPGHDAWVVGDEP